MRLLISGPFFLYIDVCELGALKLAVGFGDLQTKLFYPPESVPSSADWGGHILLLLILGKVCTGVYCLNKMECRMSGRQRRGGGGGPCLGGGTQHVPPKGPLCRLVPPQNDSLVTPAACLDRKYHGAPSLGVN